MNTYLDISSFINSKFVIRILIRLELGFSFSRSAFSYSAFEFKMLPTSTIEIFQFFGQFSITKTLFIVSNDKNFLGKIQFMIICLRS